MADTSVFLFDKKLNFQTLTKFGTEVSFGGTEASFGICEKQKCTFSRFLGQKCLFPKKLLTRHTSQKNR